jgi:hypothetical protein
VLWAPKSPMPPDEEPLRLDMTAAAMDYWKIVEAGDLKKSGGRRREEGRKRSERECIDMESSSVKRRREACRGVRETRPARSRIRRGKDSVVRFWRLWSSLGKADPA